jgi:hypothetical protein
LGSTGFVVSDVSPPSSLSGTTSFMILAKSSEPTIGSPSVSMDEPVSAEAAFVEVAPDVMGVAVGIIMVSSFGEEVIVVKK